MNINLDLINAVRTIAPISDQQDLEQNKQREQAANLIFKELNRLAKVILRNEKDVDREDAVSRILFRLINRGPRPNLTNRKAAGYLCKALYYQMIDLIRHRQILPLCLTEPSILNQYASVQDLREPCDVTIVELRTKINELFANKRPEVRANLLRSFDEIVAICLDQESCDTQIQRRTKEAGDGDIIKARNRRNNDHRKLRQRLAKIPADILRSL